jgi:octaprenyl-diphosphate synthase
LASVNSLTSKEVFDLVRADLQKVEEEFSLQSISSVQPLTEIGQYLRGSGGKRLRPALVLLSSKLCGFEGREAIRLGTVVELIHTATLVHDDVIDEADTRRGQPSTNSRWGNHLSVLAGDWLYMQAFNIALAERNFKILDLLVALTQTMVEGELLQLTWQRRIDVPEDVYFELVYRKTACLFSACLRLGALLAKARRRKAGWVLMATTLACPSSSSMMCSILLPPRRSWESLSAMTFVKARSRYR